MERKLSSKLSPDFKNLMVALLSPVYIQNHRGLQRAIDKCRWDIAAGILCHMTNYEIYMFKVDYLKSNHYS